MNHDSHSKTIVSVQVHQDCFFFFSENLQCVEYHTGTCGESGRNPYPGSKLIPPTSLYATPQTLLLYPKCERNRSLILIDFSGFSTI